MAKAKKEKVNKETTANAEEVKPEEKIIPVTTAEEAEAAEGESAPVEKPGEASPSEVDQLKIQMQQLEDQKLRALAELDNLKKRTVRQMQETIRSANDRLLGEMLEIVDNFERALQHQEAPGESASGEAMRQGTELIYNQMMDLLARYNVKPIESLGKPFDPNLHEALMSVPSEDYDEGLVAIEISKGYLQGENVLRHAKVGVSQGPNTGREEGGEESQQ